MVDGELRVVEIRNETTNYTLTASLENGELTLAGSDLSPGVEDFCGRDEYEYFYVVRAAELAQVRARLEATPANLLERVQKLLAPHGIQASTEWKRWLTQNGIPYDFHVV